jgi:hypothetical protein
MFGDEAWFWRFEGQGIEDDPVARLGMIIVLAIGRHGLRMIPLHGWE